jgi:catechol 2,3-dioxygenase-like lactoylglutathione lyase family enzyme
MDDANPVVSVTTGMDHIGLTVVSLSDSLAFFTNCLGWRLTGERPDYPAAFVTDGHLKVTLWQVKDQNNYQAFDRRQNVGLHHLAMKVGTLEDLHLLYDRVSKWPNVTTEFSPEPSGAGPKIHFMINEPGGCRIEFSWDPR